MKRLLILFAKGFPYNYSEPFLEQEYPLYREYFDRVLIVTGGRRGEKPTRRIDDDSIEILTDYTLFRDIRSIMEAVPLLLTDKMFYRECASLLRSGFTWKRFYELLTFSLCGNHRAMLALRWLKKHPDCEPEVLYAYWLHIPACAALRLKARLGRKELRVVSRCHGFDVYSHRHASNYLPFQAQCVQKIDCIASVSRAGAAYLKNKYGACENIHTRYLGAADQSRTNPYTQRTPLRVVSCARVIPLKRLSRIVDALALIDAFPVEWTHIGGNADAGNGLEKLKAYAAEKLSGKQNIRFTFCGTVPNQQIYQIYSQQEFHVFLNVSETEGLPVSVMEAMSFAIPIIATDVGGTSELIEEGKNGYLLAENYADRQLATHLMTLAEMSERDYQSMRQSARKRFEADFCAQKNNRCFIEEVLLQRVSGEEQQ